MAMGYDATIERLAQPTFIDIHASPQARPAVETVLGTALPDSSVAAAAGNTGVAAGNARVVYRLGPTQWLVRASIDQEADLLGELENATQKVHAMVTLLTDAFAVFRVAGPEARTVLCQGIAIDLSMRSFATGSATRCALAKSSAIVHCVDEAPTFDLLVDISFERYVHRWLRAAAGEPIVL